MFSNLITLQSWRNRGQRHSCLIGIFNHRVGLFLKSNYLGNFFCWESLLPLHFMKCINNDSILFEMRDNYWEFGKYHTPFECTFWQIECLSKSNSISWNVVFEADEKLCYKVILKAFAVVILPYEFDFQSNNVHQCMFFTLLICQVFSLFWKKK